MTGKPALYRYALILTIGVSAGVLLMLAWPRLRASISYLPVDTAISKYWKTREINQQQLDALIARAQQSIALHDHYRYWDGLSDLQILSSQDMSKPFWQRRLALEQSILAAEEVVRRAPAKPRAWLRIARVSAFLAYPKEQVIPALKMSIVTGRVEPTLMLSRLELGLEYLAGLDQESVLLLRDQLVLTWAMHKKTMLRQLRDGSLDFAVIRDVLSVHEQDIIAEMEAHVGQ